jgi:carboxymethylenebutenolidase
MTLPKIDLLSTFILHPSSFILSSEVPMRHSRLFALLTLFAAFTPLLRAGDKPAPSAPAPENTGEVLSAPAKTGPGTLASGLVGADFVSYQAGDETVRGYLAWPGGPGPFPAVVMIHEWWGLTPWVKDQARKMASMGYVVLAVDLYRGQEAKDPAIAHELMRGLPDDRAERYLHSAFNYIYGQKYTRKEAVGAIGWCMGGGFTARLAVLEPRLKAAVINYGALPENEKKIKGIKAHLLGNFGALDSGIPAKDVEAFAAKIRKAGGSFAYHIHNAAGHGFMNETNPSHNVAATAEAWLYIQKFLAKELGGTAP